MTEPFRAATGSFVVEPGVERSAVELGFAPGALMCWWGQDGGGNAGGVGFASEAQVATCWASADAATPTRTTRAVADAGVLALDPAGEVALRGELELATSGFAVNWSTPARSRWTVRYLALGGVVAASGAIESPTAASTVDTALGSRPDGVLVAPTGAEALDRPERGLTAAVGAAGRRGQAGSAYISLNGADEPDVAGSQRRDAAVAVPAGVADIAALARLAMTRDGFTSEWETVWPTARLVPYLALGGVRCKVGLAAAPSERVRVGFRPDALLAFSWGLSGRTEPAHIGRLCIGAATPEGGGCLSWDDRNVGGGPSSTHVHSSDSDLLVVTDTQTGGVHAAASVKSFDRRGFTLEWTTSDRIDRELVWVALAAR
ncbi:MAG: hypothetical protein ACJ77B_02950 [Chloroflexota bacterium]